ncbi:GNAT family N-acetyltransferase [Deinococcus aquiradiocola]|nr:GNAT family N-acetyltransferase [Deinococcus aquiradiocola]
MTPLDNPFWSALSGPQHAWSEGTGMARRYRPDVAPFAALQDDTPAAWAALAGLLGPDGVGVLFGHGLQVPPHWTTLRTFEILQMTYPHAAPPDAPPVTVTRLGPDDRPDMQALVTLTRPGPFKTRTPDLGAYWGVREGGRLIALAGERARPEGYCEVSAVCVHPDAQRRGLGAAVVASATAGILARGEGPFLHVAADNDAARRVYLRLGFQERTVLTVFVGRPGPG